MIVKPSDQLSAGKIFFAALGLDVRHFGAIWHVFKIGQLMTTDLNDLCGRHGISLADFHVLGALLMEAPKPLRATDLAEALNVSNAALSKRINRLSVTGLLRCAPSPSDKRTKLLTISDAGRKLAERVGKELEEQGSFAAHYRRLSPEDQGHLDRITSHLHEQLSRDFLPAPRGDG
jgi:DNA-binding MarR family transcriptional regulator